MKYVAILDRLDVVSEDFTCRSCHTKFRAFGTSTAYCKTRCYNAMVLV